MNVASDSAVRVAGPPKRYREGAAMSGAVIGVYVFLILLLGIGGIRGAFLGPPYFAAVLIALLLVFLLRYASTTYILDSERFRALRLFGSRSLRLREIRRIELANLRELGPVSFFHGWGWRGRMWSPLAGKFDAIHTISPGLLITAGEVPLFISPKRPADFARELSRRVRSSGGALLSDASRPGPEPDPRI